MNKLEKAIKEIRYIRLTNEKKEKENIMNKWLYSLNSLQLAFIFSSFWDNANFKEKENIYNRYKYK